MPPRARRLLLLGCLLGLVAGCTHRPPPAPEAATALAPLRTETPRPPPAARRTVPGTPFVRARPAEPFAPQLVVTTQAAHVDIFVQAFKHGTITYQPATRLFRGQQAFVIPFAHNYAVDALEKADLTYEIRVHKPDGSLDGAPHSLPLWQETVAGTGLVLFPQITLGFVAEPQDPVGTYRFDVTVFDHLAGETRELSSTLLLEDYAPPALPADFDPDSWFNRYYQAPTPELALPALATFFAKLPADKRVGAIPPLLGFYDQILRDNAWLLPAFATRLSSAPADEAFALSLVLGYHLRATETPPPGIDDLLWRRLADFRRHEWPSAPATPLLRAAQLDALWGAFFASGLYEPLRRLIEPLAHTADLGAAERWRRDLPATPDDASPPFPDLDDPATPIEIRREILLRTALWSLRANARQHPLVRGYLEQALRSGDLAPGARLLLERALRPDPPAPLAATPPAT
jgi:hypothetical protein